MRSHETRHTEDSICNKDKLHSTFSFPLSQLYKALSILTICTILICRSIWWLQNHSCYINGQYNWLYNFWLLHVLMHLASVYLSINLQAQSSVITSASFHNLQASTPASASALPFHSHKLVLCRTTAIRKPPLWLLQNTCKLPRSFSNTCCGLATCKQLLWICICNLRCSIYKVGLRYFEFPQTSQNKLNT